MALEFWKKKTGALPNWAWAGMGLGGAVAYSSWARNRAASKEEEATSTSSGLELPGNVAPTYAFVDADTTNITVPAAPAGGGRPPIVTLPFPTTPATPRPTPKPTPSPLPAPAKPVVKPPAAPTGKYVTVAKWTSKNTPWNSTLWGITNKLLGPKAQWQAVWQAPQNASVRAKRKDPTKIQPGDKIWVPGAK